MFSSEIAFAQSGRRAPAGDAVALKPGEPLSIGELTVILQRTAAAPPGLRPTIVVDTASHEVRLGDTRISLAKRPVLRRMLYTLAAAARESCDKETLVSRVWNVAYHPLRHDNVLRVTIHNLRAVLDPLQLRIELVDHAGYRLVPPSHTSLVLLGGWPPGR